MRTLIHKIFTLILLLVWPALIMAQASHLPYICGFEEDEDLSNWVLNYGTPTAEDQWIKGKATRSEGQRSLYISTNGYDAQYGKSPNITVSYMTIKFPTSTKQQNYDLSFDWKCEGNADKSRLYVMVCPEQLLFSNQPNNFYYLNNIVSSTSGILSTTIINNVCQKLGPTQQSCLFGNQAWTNVSLSNEIKVSSANSKYAYAIVFIWVNNNNDEKVTGLGACIDNVQIGSANIKKPVNLVAESLCEDSTIMVSWESAASTFLVEYKAISSTTWRRADGLTQGIENFSRQGNKCSYIIQRVSEGNYELRVKGASLSGDTSVYSYCNDVLVYCPYNHCINYMDLDNPNLICTFGYTEHYSSKPGSTPYDNIGYVNFGPDAKESRHTIHTDPNELDVRTDTMLHTVPTGAVGSVRLGNWATSGEAESMTYSFVVDSAQQGVLIVKYAVVLNKPQESCGDPGFRMVVLDEDGQEIDELCGKADFSYSSAKAAGWNETKDGNVVWKDWTSVGINLQPYNGRMLRVQLTTRDCGGGGHYGYAYFTLDCASAYIETENCGADSKIVCEAPDGFAYEWRNENGEIVSTQKSLVVDASMQTYTCRVSFIEEPSCFFEVSTLSAPRFPVPQISWQPVYENCTSKLKFSNQSHVMNKYEGFERHTSELCNDCHWSFTRKSDGTTTESYNWNPLYSCPSTHDTIHVLFTCYIGQENACDSTIEYDIPVVDITARDSVVLATICEGETFYFGGEYRDKDSTYVVTLPNFAGCDSIATLHLTVHPKSPELQRFDSICSTQSVVIGGRTFSLPGDYSIWLKNQYECDSVVNLHLYVNQKMSVLPDSMEKICADNMAFNISYATLEGRYDSIWVNFSEEANQAGLRDTMITQLNQESITIPYAANVVPGNYTVDLNFIQHCCDTLVHTLPFAIHYASSVLEQKWNDVIALLSSKHNGGYSFTQYQWYKDDQPIPGQNRSYLFTPLEEGAAYSLMATRSDGVTTMTCPVYYIYHEQAREYPTIVQPSQTISLRMSAASTMRFVTTGGQVYSQHSFPAGTISVTAPALSGVYVWQTQVEGEDAESHYLIVTNSK